MGGRAYAATAALLTACIAFGHSAAAAGDGATLLLFSGGDIWRHGGFLHGGLLYSPGGLANDGFTFRAVISGGRYRYLSGGLGNIWVAGQETVFQFTPGWRWRSGTTEIKVFAGVDLQRHDLTPDDPGSRLRGTQAGGRVAFEFWTEPVPAMMVAVDGSLSSVATSYSLRAATGWRVFDRFYIGPEAQGFASGDYRQVRAGLHITGLRFGPLEWSAGAGFARDSDRQTGAYARLGLFSRR